MESTGNINFAPRISGGDRTTVLISPTQLLDHRTIDWKLVSQATYWMEQKFEYNYPGPIKDLSQRLMVIPPDSYGDQHLIAFEVGVSSPLAVTSSEVDPFGNRLLRIQIPYIDESVTFTLKMVIRRDFSQPTSPRISAADASSFLEPTRLTTIDSHIEEIAQTLLATSSQPEKFAELLATWIYEKMSYGRGHTTVDTSAAEALQIGHGLCQDYAHIMLATCRAAGISARYVSGHLLGEGHSHAWVEILIPEAGGEYCALAFDPTNHRRTTPNYITIATGRDYKDVSPTSGSYTAPYAGQLTATKRAGVTDVTYRG